MKSVILNTFLGNSPGEDELDNLEETRAVEETLKMLNFDVKIIPFSSNLKEMVQTLKKIKPDFVFNLVESIEGDGSLIYFAPAILDSLRIPYTGNHTDAMYITSNKIVTKNILKSHGIKTPKWTRLNEITKNDSLNKKKVIIKHVWEHASKNIDDDSIFFLKNKSKLENALKKRENSENYFAEEFIEGREFNLSIIEDSKGVHVLSPAEMHFTNYPKGKDKVVNYKAKWNKESFEYKNTMRSFEFNTKDKKILALLKKISRKVWDIFNLNGFARVDFRVDKKGNPYVLEINANPCISPDGGFIAACEREGMNYKQVISKLITEVCKK